MYIIELIFKKLLHKKEKHSYNPISEESSIDFIAKEYENCKHTFMPIDSTQEILACTKCGILKKKSELKNKNIFAKRII